MQLLMVLPILIAIYILSSVWTVVKNVLAAQKSGFAVYASPVNPINPLWMVSHGLILPILRKILPDAALERIEIATHGWEGHRQYSTHAKYGASFMYATPAALELWIADEEIANEVLARRNDFFQPDLVARIIGIFGPNVVTSNGDSWLRQRKLLAPNLNERIMGHVWAESSAQAEEMLEYFLTSVNGETNETIPGLRTIAVNVLGSAAYGISQRWEWDAKVSESRYKLTYRDAAWAVVNNLVPAAIVPAFISSLPIMPESIRRVGTAVQEFPRLSKEMLEVERKSATSHASPRNNIMSTLVRLSDGAKDDRETNSKSQSLTEEEIMGNLFVVTIAGFDTTANTLAYAVAILAVQTEWQDWIIEEIDRFGHGEMGKDYARTFPKLPRCLALMHETLRLYSPVSHMIRVTSSPQVLTKGPETFVIPAKTFVYINNGAIHTNPETWGADCLDFRPTRWLTKNSASDDVPIIMPRGRLMAWSGGPRACVGQKMSQVEFVAVIASIFRRYTVAPILDQGETVEAAKHRLRETIKDSTPSMTMRMNRPQDVRLKWSRR